GSAANGSGSFLFAGANSAGSVRRSLVAFDVASLVPAGSTITGVSLTFNCNQASSGTETLILQRLLASWSEGASDPSGAEGAGTTAAAGDVTWTERNFGAGQPWASAGADFVASASASTPNGALGPVTFATTPALVADVQGW